MIVNAHPIPTNYRNGHIKMLKSIKLLPISSLQIKNKEKDYKKIRFGHETSAKNSIIFHSGKLLTNGP